MARRSYTIKDIPATLNRVSEVNADAEKKKRLTEAHYQRQVKDMQNMHHIRSRLLDESARNLQHEVTRGDSNMDPQHTTLFVRSYK